MTVFCPICNASKKKEEALCEPCLEALKKETLDRSLSRCPKCYYPVLLPLYKCNKCNEDNSYTIYCVSRYDGKLSYSVLDSFKFQERKEFSIVVAHFLKMALSVLDPEGKAMLVPIPCSAQSLKKRGWDHMIEVCEDLKRPYVRALENCLDVSQKKLSRLERIDLAKKRFQINEKMIGSLEQYKDRKIIVVDDICTTMSTMKAAIDILRNEGFSDVVGAAWMLDIMKSSGDLDN